jgi:hypothetical protein
MFLVILMLELVLSMRGVIFRFGTSFAITLTFPLFDSTLLLIIYSFFTSFKVNGLFMWVS